MELKNSECEQKIVSKKKEINNLGFNIINQSINKSKSNSNFNDVFKNKIFEN
jgi:hypothetical protein